ncbi:MAG: hypothetical protein APF76_15545 [Desulfitibacter sp. BRH_c19]|nr:MAG: hypothetical protein APF76_15545 [Desulfitibacter sp. BRH_c19]
MVETWRLIDSNYNDGFYNMAVDEVLLSSVIEGKSPPTIRFYRWQPATVTLGYFQDMDKEIETEICKKKGIQVVRRLTGGRAILHDNELTYSLTANEKEKQVSGSIIESYLKISQALVNGLNIYGVEVEMMARPSKEKGSAACFDAPSWHEIVWNGRKLVGSAQTRKQGFLLQHGSLPFSLDVELLFQLLRISNAQVKERLKKNFQQKAVSLEEITQKEVDYKKLVEALVQGFSQTFNIKVAWDDLSKEEKANAQELKETKYSQNAWNNRKGNTSCS